MEEGRKTALVLIFNGVEELEAVAPIDVLRRAGVDVTVASLGPETRVTGRNVLNLEADCTFEPVLGQTFDLVLLPGGPGVKHLRASPEVIRLVRDQAARGRLLAAICAAPLVLHDAGLLEGRRFTCHTSVEAELAGAEKSQPVVRDGNIITSRGAGTAILFGLVVAGALVGRDAADAVARAICHPA